MMNEMEYRTIGSALAGGYRAAVYCRLSKDDDLQGESASIANQRDMLEKYCEKQGWEVVAVYQDDGFTYASSLLWMLITGLWKLYSTVMFSNSTSLISGSSVQPLSVS